MVFGVWSRCRGARLSPVKDALAKVGIREAPTKKTRRPLLICRFAPLPSAVGFGPRRIGHVSVLPRGRGWLLCSLVSVCWTGRTATNRDMPSPKRSSPFLAGVAFAKLKPRSEGYFLFYLHFLSGSETDQPCYRTIFPTSKFNWGNVGPIPGSAKRETCCTTSASPPN